MLRLYRGLTSLLPSLLKGHLKRRLKLGKEDPARLYERFGGASLSRPKGKLIWIHAASVGESMSVLQLIQDMQEQHPDIAILLTTGTVTSARLMASRLPKTVIHQYMPLDIPKWVARFLDHWQPNEAVFLESELWPNMLQAIKSRSIPLLLLNARLSEKSYRRWRWVKGLATELFSYFDQILTPSLETALRFKDLGAKHIDICVNLKFMAATLPIDQTELSVLKEAITRPIFAATSTHSGEEQIILDTYQELRRIHPDLLLILAPRHPNRSNEVKQLLLDQQLSFSVRSLRQVPSCDDHVWVFDTIGELGLIYSLAPFCFLGGSLVSTGGHNPIEPLALGCLVIQGQHTFNFNDVNLVLNSVLAEVKGKDDLVKTAKSYLTEPEELSRLKIKSDQCLAEQRCGLPEIIQRMMEAMN